MFRVKTLVMYLLLFSTRGFAHSSDLRETTVRRIEHKLFPVLQELNSGHRVRSAVAISPESSKFFAERRLSLNRAVTDCDVNATCLNSAFRFSPADRSTALTAFTDIYRQDPHIRLAVDRIVCKSTAYPLYSGLGCEHAFVKAVDDELTSVNNAIDIFGDGKSSTRGSVDVAQYDTQSLAYRQTLSTLARNAIETHTLAPNLFQSEILYASYLLVANSSDFVARFSTLNSVENAAAVKALAHVDWRRYGYSAILVPGLGPEIAGVPVSPGGRARLRIAVQRYRDGLAPVIIVSGGNVHPAHTQFNEGIEMKKMLIEEFGVSPNAILVEPLARHTTTNLRNVARLLVRYRVGLVRPVLVTTDVFQTRSIRNGQVNERCLQTLGYVPFQIVNQISPTETSLTLKPESLQTDPRDPLDP